MRIIGPALIGIFLAQLLGCGQSETREEIRVITDRTASHLEKIFKYYEEAHKVKIAVNFVGDSLLTRLRRRSQEADLVVTKNAQLLELAKQNGLLAPFKSQEILGNVPVMFRDPDQHYLITSFRARAIFYAKDRVSPKDLASYDDLAQGKWKGRVCIRSGFHEYNVSLFSEMAVSQGIEKVEAFIKRLRDNLAFPPKGNDRAQVRGLLEKKCDVAVANSYYMGIMLKRDDQKAWALASDVLFPNQSNLGTYVLRSGAGLTTSSKNVPRATRLLEFLTSEFAQYYFSEALHEYPVKPGVPLTPVNTGLGKAQGIEGGAYKVNLISLKEAVKYRDKVIEILTRVNFDRK
ncbi:MAG: extracellular solute-binding protein [Proteobacteria bacterium]|nr:extracellular solute-binding protein [Pseudomonadota bacterium]